MLGARQDNQRSPKRDASSHTASPRPTKRVGISQRKECMDKDHEQKKPPPNADVDRYNVLDDLSEEIWKEAMRLFVKEKKKMACARWVVDRLPSELIEDKRESLTEAARSRLKRYLSGVKIKGSAGRKPRVSDAAILSWHDRKIVNDAARKDNSVTNKDFFDFCVETAVQNGDPFRENKISGKDKDRLLQRRDELTGHQVVQKVPRFTSAQRAKAANNPTTIQEYFDRLKKALVIYHRKPQDISSRVLMR